MTIEDVQKRVGALEEKIKGIEDKPKPKDGWDKFATITSFVSSVVLVAIATSVTVVYQQAEATRASRALQAEQEQQQHNTRLRELEVVEKFVPYLTGEKSSEESKKLAIIALHEFASIGIATKYAEAFPSPGAVDGLDELRSRSTKDERQLIDATLRRIRAKNPSGNEAPFKGRSDRAEFGAWNLHLFGRPDQQEAGPWKVRLSTVAQAIARLDVDALALAEVTKPALEDLRKALALRGYEADFLIRETGTPMNLAILFNKRKVRASDLSTAFDRRFKQQLEARTKGGRKAFRRLPLFAKLTFKESCEEIELTAIVVHLRAASPLAERNLARQVASRSLAHIVKTLRADGNDSIILAGDFNGNIESPALEPLKNSPDLISLAEAEGADATTFLGSRNSTLDYLFITQGLASRVRDNQFNWKDAPAVRLDKEVWNYKTLVSDHVPIVAPLAYSACVAAAH